LRSITVASAVKMVNFFISSRIYIGQT